jgi:ribosomal protein S18 acetylase RimI-like enzyme
MSERAMSGAVTIREASKPDLPDILRIYAQPDLDDGHVLDLADAGEIFDRMTSYPNYKVYVAESEDGVVGTFALLIMDNMGHLGRRSAIVEDVAVDPSVQGKGVGKVMMRHAIALAKTHDCYKVTLSSNMKRERAHAFYDSLGFERHGYSFRADVP